MDSVDSDQTFETFKTVKIAMKILLRVFEDLHRICGQFQSSKIDRRERNWLGAVEGLERGSIERSSSKTRTKRPPEWLVAGRFETRSRPRTRGYGDSK